MADTRDPLGPMIDRLKEPVALAPDLTDRIMAAVRETAPEVPAPKPAWWRRRWTVEITPVSALAAAATLAAIAVGAWSLGTRRLAAVPGIAPTPALASISAATPTQFLLVAPNAAAVTVVGDFNDWNAAATPLVRATAGAGLWWVTVPLRPGRYRYAFVVDGTVWRPDPEAPAVDDEFGRPSSVLTIGGGG